LLMGGTKVKLYKIGTCNINFKDKQNNLKVITFDDLKVSQSAWTRPSAISSGTSILGLNFLRDTKLYLFADPSNDTAYLSDERQPTQSVNLE